MFRLTLLLCCCLVTVTLAAQQQFPSLPINIDSVFNICSSTKTTGAEKKRLLRVIDSAIDGLQPAYPLFRGMVYMYQAYYMPYATERNTYLSNGISLIRHNNKYLADSFSLQCYQLLDYYSWDKRTDEWMPVDSILRSVVTAQPNDRETCILMYADKKMKAGDYRVAKNLADYDLLYGQEKNPPITDYRLMKVYGEWISVNSRYQQWLNVPYYQRNQNFNLKEDFLKAILHLDLLKDSAVIKNQPGQTYYKHYQRTLYYVLYKNILQAYAGWSIHDHREGQAILPLKQFLLYDLIPNEAEPADKAKLQPVIPCTEIRDLFAQLAELYMNIGSGTAAADVCERGIRFFSAYKNCEENNVSAALSYMLYLQTKAHRIAGKYETSLKRNKLLKTWWPLPQQKDEASMNYWNWYIESRLQEVYTLMAQKKTDAGLDSLNLLLTNLEAIENDSVDLLYKSYQWPQLQYISMQYMAAKGKWDVVKDYLLEALTIVEQDNHWENVAYYYDMQRLYFIAKYKTTGEVQKNIVYNMLFYTGRHLQSTFLMLTPEDRIRLYEQKLSVYFDLYHELLFGGLIKDDTLLQQKIIDQSLYLKNALADGNLLPNEFFAGDTDSVRTQLIEKIRTNRNNTNIIASRLKMRRNDEVDISATDEVQLLWLKMLQNANIDSLVGFSGWKKIAASLQPEQLYIEAIRYNKWLSDSSAVYAAYIIQNGKLDTVSLFAEKDMLLVLNDPAASPQSGSLSSNNARGLTLTKKQESKTTFKKGAEDKLGTLVLSALWKYINTKKELLVVPDGLLNRISLAALEWKHQPLMQHLLIRQLSGSNILSLPGTVMPAKGKALLAGGLDYGERTTSFNYNRLLNKDYAWQYLPATKKEVNELQPVFTKSGKKVTVLTGNAFPDTLRNVLSQYQFIHLATHGFYVDTTAASGFYSNYWNKESIFSDPMMRCGIAVSNANEPLAASVESEGHLLGYELANTDLRNCYLITLSACETGLGDLRNNLGVDGLSRALKLGGAKHLLISLWKVPDEPTAVFMNLFYKNLFQGKTPALALRTTQQQMSIHYPVTAWAAFILVE